MPTRPAVPDRNVPWAANENELLSILQQCLAGMRTGSTADERRRNNVRCVAQALTATLNYVNNVRGLSPSETHDALMGAIRNSRCTNAPLAIIDGTQMLYPCYNIPAIVESWLRTWRVWAAREARVLLREHPNEPRDYREHWEKLAAQDTADGLEENAA